MARRAAEPLPGRGQHLVVARGAGGFGGRFWPPDSHCTIGHGIAHGPPGPAAAAAAARSRSASSRLSDRWPSGAPSACRRAPGAGGAGAQQRRPGAARARRACWRARRGAARRPRPRRGAGARAARAPSSRAPCRRARSAPRSTTPALCALTRLMNSTCSSRSAKLCDAEHERDDVRRVGLVATRRAGPRAWRGRRRAAAAAAAGGSGRAQVGARLRQPRLGRDELRLDVVEPALDDRDLAPGARDQRIEAGDRARQLALVRAAALDPIA